MLPPARVTLASTDSKFVQFLTECSTKFCPPTLVRAVVSIYAIPRSPCVIRGTASKSFLIKL